MPFKSEKQRKWMHANEPEMADKWEKEESIREKLRNLIKQEIKSIKKEDHIKFSEEEMAQLHKDGKVEKGGHTIEFNESINESPMAPFSSSEAKQHINQDIKKMSKHLGKASQQSIKIMMDGVRGAKYTAMDISRGIKEGPAGRAHIGELGFLQQLWNKVRDGFRRYTKDRKLS